MTVLLERSPRPLTPHRPRHPTDADRVVDADPYPWPYDGAIDPARTALVYIDWQVDFCGPGGYVDTMGYDLEPDPGRPRADRQGARPRSAPAGLDGRPHP